MEDFKKWMYVIISILLMMIYGTVYSWSIFRVPVEAYYNVGSTLSGLPYMVSLLTYALSMLVGGKLIGRYSQQKLLLFGAAVISIGWITSYLSTHIGILTLTYGILIGFGVGISYGVPIVGIAKWFPEKRGVIVGVVLAGFGLSPLLTAPLGHWLIESFGLTKTFLYYGIAFGIIIPILSTMMSLPENESKKENKKDVKQLKGDFLLNEEKMTKTKSFPYVYICFLIGTMIGLTIIGLTNNVGRELIKIDTAGIALLMTVFALFNGAGRPLFGWITEKYGPVIAMRLSFVLILLASGFMLFSNEGTTAIYIISFSVLWLNLGAWLAIAPMTTMSLYGMERYSSNYGIMFTAYGFGAVAGVISTGLLIDFLNNYKAIFVFIILLAFIGLLVNKNMANKIKIES